MFRGGERAQHRIRRRPDGLVVVQPARRELGLRWQLELTDSFANTCALSPAGDLLAVATDRGLQLAKVGSSEQPKLWGQRKDLVHDCAFSPDGSLLAAVGSNLISLWNTLGIHLSDFGSPRGTFTSCLFTPDSNRLMTTSADGLIRTWDARSCVEEAERQLQAQTAVALSSSAISCDGRLLVTGDEEGSISGWDLERADQLFTSHQAHMDGTVRVSFSPDGKTIASTGFAGELNLWECDSRGLVPTVTLNAGSDRSSCAFSPDGRLLAGVGWDGRISLWSGDGSVKLLEERSSGAPDDCCFTADGRSLITVGDDIVRSWRLPV